MERIPYAYLRAGIFGFLALYFAAGLYLFLDGTFPEDETYPFFAWTLFRVVPQPEASAFRVRITAVDGKTLAAPLFFDEAGPIVSKNQTLNYRFIEEALGKAVAAQDSARIEAARRSIEDSFTANQVRYEVIEVNYRTIEYWKTRTYDTLRVLASFETPRA